MVINRLLTYLDVITIHKAVVLGMIGRNKVVVMTRFMRNYLLTALQGVPKVKRSANLKTYNAAK